MRQNLYDYCIEYGKESLLQQWNSEKNVPLTPQGITYGSHHKIWWKCEHKHEWQAAVYTRTTSGNGCPYCAGLKIWPGENDLLSTKPDIAAQWHPAKNGKLTPDQVTVGSHKAVWWICGKGHEWKAMVKTRVEGSGCPYCANRAVIPGENDLATTHPELVLEWHPTKNSPLTPCDVVAGTTRKVWWRCAKGHEWQATISSRAQGRCCPVCAGKIIIPGENDLASQFPAVAEQWDEEKNGSLRPQNVSPYSNRKVWWRCELGHAYPAIISARASGGSGCPYCMGRKVLPGFNDLASVEPKVASQWHPTLNGALTPEMVTTGSHRKVWWECPVGHIWKAVVYSRAGPQKCGCPVCAGRVRSNRLERYAAVLAEQVEHHGESRV